MTSKQEKFEKGIDMLRRTKK